MKNIFITATLLFCFSASAYSFDSNKEWYEGCPKYTNEEIENLKGGRVETVEELQQYSKEYLEESSKKIDCEIKNLEEYKKRLIKKLEIKSN